MHYSGDTMTPGSLRASAFQVSALIALRLLIGWHFLYEGITKLTSPYWSSSGYLADSKWLFDDLFIALGSSTTAVTVIDYLNMWGLTLIGLCLLLGLFVRAASVAGIALLALYWLAAPPFAGYTYGMPSEGSYLIVNKVLIELGALLVVFAVPTSQRFGLDRFLARHSQAKPPVHTQPAVVAEVNEPVRA